MTQDWNWFFSSLSQSAAAIVGIFGAFIITKIFSNQTSFTEKNTKLTQAIIQADKIKDNANSHNMSWYNKHHNNQEFMKFEDFLEERFNKEENPNTVTDEILDDFIKQSNFSKYSENNEIRKELSYIIEKKFEHNASMRQGEEAADEAEAQLRSGPFANIYATAHIMSNMKNLNDMINPKPRPNFFSYSPLYTSPWKELTEEREGLERSYLEAKHHARLAADLLEITEGNPESPSQISAALILVLLIFFVGVIYPLSFMPASGAPELSTSIEAGLNQLMSFKGILLSVISLAFTVIVSIFYTTNFRMKYNQNTLNKIKELTNTNNYCKYFKYIHDTSSPNKPKDFEYIKNKNQIK